MYICKLYIHFTVYLSYCYLMKFRMENFQLNKINTHYCQGLYI